MCAPHAKFHPRPKKTEAARSALRDYRLDVGRTTRSLEHLALRPPRCVNMMPASSSISASTSSRRTSLRCFSSIRMRNKAALAAACSASAAARGQRRFSDLGWAR